MTLTLDDARALDRDDPLGGFRARFRLPEGRIYLDGNSLGALPASTPERVRAVVEDEWGRDLIAGWTRHGWIDAPARVGARIAPLIGAAPHEVVVTDSTSVNLFKLLAAALARDPARRTVVSEPGNFPTDLYVAEGAIGLTPGARLRLAPAGGLDGALDAGTAVLMLTHVHYTSGALHDMAALTRLAHARGALVLWDLSHSVGAVPFDLNGCGADLAVGCGYKHLNGGPGAPAFLFVAERLQSELRSPLSGWMGHAEPFAFDDAYRPAEGMARWLCGTPSPLALAALEQGVELVAEAGMPRIVEKSRRLSALFVEAVEARCGGLGLTLASPRDPAARGGHASFRHPQGFAVMQALIARRVVGDFRAPDLMRFGFAPLYNSHEDVWRAAEALGQVLESRAYEDPRFQTRGKVT